MDTAKSKDTELQLTPREALELHRKGGVLLDIRSADEQQAGRPQGARDAGSNQDLPAERPLLLICARGKRSMERVRQLALEGACEVFSVAGGFDAWREAGLPVENPAGLGSKQVERYARHLVLPEVGSRGQQALLEASVVLVGAGGLGSPAALYLAAAGVGHLRIVDADVVERSNLQRQVLHGEALLGAPKTQSAEQRLRDLNPDTRVELVFTRAHSGNVDELLQGASLVIDGSDNFPTRFLLSDACLKNGVPLVYGAVLGFEGQASVFDPAAKRGTNPCYRCVFPEPPSAADAPDCATAGVLGVLPGLIGLVQATEAIKLILGQGDSLVGRLLRYDALNMSFKESRVRADPDCAYCAAGRAFPGYVDYEAFCDR